MEGISKFAEHIIHKRHEARNVEDSDIISTDSSYTKISILEDIRVTTHESGKPTYVYNDIINGKKELLYSADRIQTINSDINENRHLILPSRND